MTKILCSKMKNWFNQLTLKTRTTRLADGTLSIRPVSLTWFYSLLVVVIVVYFFNLIVLNYFRQISFSFFVSRIPNFFTILAQMVTQLDVDYLSNTLNPLLDTLKMAYLGTLIGSLTALPIAFLASQNIVKNRYLSITMKLILSLFRTLPSILYALIFAFVFGYGTFVGTISLAVFTLAISSKILYENIETLDMGAFQAIESTGATKLQAFTVSILPQIYGNFVSTALYSFEINIRYSAILGFVGAGGIGILLNDAMSLRDYGKVSVMLLGLLFLVLITENVSRYVRKRVNA
jgi:phosphonate transport system permease protein